MAYTRLVFFGTYSDSIYGTLRGLISFIPMSILFMVISNNNQYVPALLLALTMCSALGVQLPQSFNESLLYGALVGLCISTSYICMSRILVQTTRGTIYTELVLVVAFTIFTTLLAIITRFMSLWFDLYPL